MHPSYFPVSMRLYSEKFHSSVKASGKFQSSIKASKESQDSPKINSGKTETKSGSLPPQWKEQIKDIVRQDIEKGVYMDKEYISVKQQYLKDNVSPNRARAIAQVSRSLNTAHYTNGRGSILDLLGLPYYSEVTVGASITTAEIYNESGEMIAGYHSDNGWCSVPTKAETQFGREANLAYSQVWDEIKQEMQTAYSQDSGSSPSASLNTYA